MMAHRYSRQVAIPRMLMSERARFILARAASLSSACTMSFERIGS